MATTLMNPLTGKPVSEDWFWAPNGPPTRQNAEKVNESVFYNTAPSSSAWVSLPQQVKQQAIAQQTQVNAPALAPVAQSSVQSSGTGNMLSGLLDSLGKNAPQMPVNEFASQLQQYLAQGAPQGARANAFEGDIKSYLGSPGPVAEKATLAENRYAGGLTQAEQRLQDLINNPEALQNSASYKFRVQQGQQALERSLGARGLLQSGNRLSELTKYGQDMGSQEYEAENARRMGLFNSYAGNYNTDQANNVNLLGVQQGSLDKQYATAADLFKTRGATLADLYSKDSTAANQQYATAGDIYGRQGTNLASLYGSSAQAGSERYRTDVGARTSYANTLADLYRTDVDATTSRYGTDVNAQTAKLPYEQAKKAEQPWWMSTPTDFMGRPIG